MSDNLDDDTGDGTATEASLPETEEEIKGTLCHLKKEVDVGTQLIRNHLAKDAEMTQWWTPRQLQDLVSDAGYSSSVSSLSFWRLVDLGELEIDENMHVTRVDKEGGQ